MIELLQTPLDFILKALVAYAVWYFGSRWALDLFMKLVVKIPKFPMGFYGPVRIAFLVLVAYIALGVVGIDLSSVFGWVFSVIGGFALVIVAGLSLAFALSKRGQDLVSTRVQRLVLFVEGLFLKK